MLSIVGAIIGLLGSFIPKLLEIWKIKADHAHELAILQVQADMARAGHQYRMEEIHAQADIASEQAVYKHAEVKTVGVRWADALLAVYSGTVRPTVTYLFIIAYIFVKYAQLQVVMAAGTGLWQTVWQLWNSEDMAALMTILGFWFGGRLLKSNLVAFDVGKPDNGYTVPTRHDSTRTHTTKVKPKETAYDPPTDYTTGA